MKTEKYIYLNIAIGLSVNDPFVYKMNADLFSPSIIGERVRVSLQNRLRIGYIVSCADRAAVEKLSFVKEIDQLLDTEPIIDEVILKLTRFISQYYVSSWGEAIENALPAYLKTKAMSVKEILARMKKRKSECATKEKRAVQKRQKIILNKDQHAALEAIERAIDNRTHDRFLLFGVTGSGKTEVYVRAIKKARVQKRGAICLFPEIALTTHLEDYFRFHFGDTLAVLHSRLSQKERFLEWKAIYDGAKTVIIGPRSAIFAPVTDCGLIIIDEEHENTYKQNETPRYHTRVVAFKRAELDKAILICGGATPSLELMYAAKAGTVRLLSLAKRVVNRPLPEVKLIDMKNEIRNNKTLLISQYLEDAIRNTLREKEQILIFLNRRGFATTIQCKACGELFVCKRCQIPLTYHQEQRRLLCHYCDYKMKMPDVCTACGSAQIRYTGAGTERLESHCARLFPEAHIERFDTDRVRKKGSHEAVLSRFKNKEIDILVGTQMITKGFDFPDVTLVGVINADTMLSLPDFRSSERTFQLLTQVAGRAGRGERRGAVVVQTYSPKQYAIQAAQKHDYDMFYAHEISIRKELGYPPFTRLINIIIRARQEKRVRNFAEMLKKEIEVMVQKSRIEMLGPAPLPFYRLHGYYRWHIMLKGLITLQTITAVKQIINTKKKTVSCAAVIDVSPQNIL